MGAQVSAPPYGDVDVWTPKAYSVLPQHAVKVEAVVLSAARFPIPPPRGGDDLQKPEVFFS